MAKTTKDKQKDVKVITREEKTSKEKAHEEAEKLKNILLIHSKH